jgi:hypothetical protein
LLRRLCSPLLIAHPPPRLGWDVTALNIRIDPTFFGKTDPRIAR